MSPQTIGSACRKWPSSSPNLGFPAPKNAFQFVRVPILKQFGLACDAPCWRGRNGIRS
jgi:hypothetical protein